MGSFRFDQILKDIEKEASRFPRKMADGLRLLSSGIDCEVGKTPAEVVYKEDKMQVLHYKPLVGQSDLHPTPVLITYALINRYVMLDLEPGRSFVQNLLRFGLDVYLIDWGRPSAADRYLDLGDYIDGYLDAALEQVRARSGADRVNLMGICMGGIFSLIYTALYPEKVKNLITLATPVNFDVGNATLFLWAKEMDVDIMVDAFGNLPGDLANILYLLAVPVDTVNKYVQFLAGMDDPDFVSTFLRMEKWIFDSPDMAGETFRQFFGEIIQKNLLIGNKLKVNGRPVDLSRIRCPLLNVYGKKDYLAPPETSLPLAAAVGSEDTATLGVDTGHIGIFVGGTSYRTICPHIVDWIKQR